MRANVMEERRNRVAMTVVQHLEDEKLAEKLGVLTKMKLLGKVWAAFFKDQTFALAPYRAMFVDMYISAIRGVDIDLEQLLALIPDKDKRTRDKRVDELLELHLIDKIEKNLGKERKVFYVLSDALRNHLDLYVDYFQNKVTESDPRIMTLLALG